MGRGSGTLTRANVAPRRGVKEGDAKDQALVEDAFEANVDIIKDDSLSQNSIGIEAFRSNQKHFIGVYYVLSKSQKKRCYWCDTLQDSSRAPEDLLPKWKIDMVRDYSQGGDTSISRGSVTNCVLVCNDCMRQRYSGGADSLEKWLESDFIDPEKKEDAKARAADIKAYFGSLAETKQSARDITKRHEAAKQEQRKEMAAEKAKSFGLRIEDRTPEITGSVRKVIRKQLFEDGHKHCVWCRMELVEEREREDSLTLDHVQTLHHGGSHWYGNMLPACGHCNSWRGDLTVEEFVKYAKNPDTEFIDSRLILTNSDPRTFHSYWDKKQGRNIFKYDKKAGCYNYLKLEPLNANAS